MTLIKIGFKALLEAWQKGTACARVYLYACATMKYKDMAFVIHKANAVRQMETLVEVVLRTSRTGKPYPESVRPRYYPGEFHVYIPNRMITHIAQKILLPIDALIYAIIYSMQKNNVYSTRYMVHLFAQKLIGISKKTVYLSAKRLYANEYISLTNNEIKLKELPPHHLDQDFYRNQAQDTDDVRDQGLLKDKNTVDTVYQIPTENSGGTPDLAGEMAMQESEWGYALMCGETAYEQ